MIDRNENSIIHYEFIPIYVYFHSCSKLPRFEIKNSGRSVNSIRKSFCLFSLPILCSPEYEQTIFETREQKFGTQGGPGP